MSIRKQAMRGRETQGIKCVGVSRGQWRTSIALVNTTANEKQALRGCKPWPMKNKHCLGEKAWPFKSCGSSKTLWGLEFWLTLRVPTPNSSFVCANSPRLLYCSTQVSPLMNNIRLYFYISVFLVVCQDPAVVYYTTVEMTSTF